MPEQVLCVDDDSRQHTRDLHRDGLVSRTSYPQVPPRVEYELTDLGATLLVPLNGLVTWAEEHRGEVDEHRARFDQRR